MAMVTPLVNLHLITEPGSITSQLFTPDNINQEVLLPCYLHMVT